MLDSKLTKKSEAIIVSAYNSKGKYGDFPYELSVHDYRVIVAESTGILEKSSVDFDWEYNINYIHTISWVLGAYSYVSDSCDIYNPDGTLYSGYNRHIRLEWKLNIKSGKYEIVDVYEYITPGAINTFFDMFS